MADQTDPASAAGEIPAPKRDNGATGADSAAAELMAVRSTDAQLEAAQPCAAKTEQRKIAFQMELFWRELNEVHLLLDFVSGRNDKSLGALAGIPAAPGSATLSWDQVVDKICQIRFPPVGTPETKALDAAFLLIVKDHLNGIADPARGLSVAYTAMFSGVALGSRTPVKAKRQALAANDDVDKTAQPAKPGDRDGAWSDFDADAPSYAREAYPSLDAHARRFKFYFDILPLIVFVLMLVTGLFYWDTALSNSILQQVVKADTQVVALLQNNPTLPMINGVCSRQINADQVIPCQQLQFLRLQQALGRRDLAALSDEHSVLHPIGIVTRAFNPPDLSEAAGFGCFINSSVAIGTSPASAQPSSQAQPSLQDLLRGAKYCEAFSPSALEQMTAAVTNVFNIYIVPMMFGLLGTFAGLVRTISWKVRESTLYPRDYKLSIMTPFLGGVAGLAVGLIFSSPSTYSETVTGLPQSITLSAAAFAFLAGYGADSFFVMIDNLLKRIFINERPSVGNRG